MNLLILLYMINLVISKERISKMTTPTINLPISYTTETINNVAKHWHEHIEIIYILSGSLNINVNNQNYLLNEDDLILVNSYNTHTLKANSCKILSFHINLHNFYNPVFYEFSRQYDCNSRTIEHQDKLIIIKKLLAQIVKINQKKNSTSLLLSYSYAYELMHHLWFSFLVESTNLMENKSILGRFEEIINYLTLNYNKKLTLKDVADKFFLSPPYLSKTFKDFMGTGFKDYLSMIRLTRSISDIVDRDISISELAEKHGFPNTSAFVHIFKDKYKMLPSEYRKQLGSDTQSLTLEKQRSSPRPALFLHKNDFGQLASYLENKTFISQETTIKTKLTEIESISTRQKGYPLTHNYKTIMTIGKAKQILFAQNQELLKEIQKEIGYKYLRFHGLLDDDMMVYTEDEEGKSMISFTYIDMVIDFIKSIGLKPFMQLTYMPKDLALTPEHTMYQLESVISLPKDYEKWEFLIRELVLHLESRYGSEEVETWPFSVWNEPDSPINLFGFKYSSDYYNFYKRTYHTVKRCNKNILFGGPSIMTTTIEEGTWINEFLDYCTRNDCYPEFLNYHFYPNILDQNTQLNKGIIIKPNLVIRYSEDAFKDNIYLVKNNAKINKWDINKIYVTEWNLSISHRELLNDTAFKAPYIIKNILENFDQLASFGYWSLTDFIEEVKMSHNLFHGGMGLYTYNGIKKSSYFALTLLSRLGNTLLGKGDGYFITKTESSYQIILYNYVHFSPLYSSGELFDMTFTNRYTPFPDEFNRKFILPLADLTHKSFTITDTILNRRNGSSFDKWIELGALPLETTAETDYLKAISIPKLMKQRLNVKNNYLTISRELEPHEVRLIEIHPHLEG